ncbi:MAG: putative oligopeptidase [Pseudomonadota bacterium]
MNTSQVTAMSNTNPLLDFSDLPLFDAIEPTHVASALDVLLKAADAALEQVTAADFPPRWTAIASVLDVATEKLSRAWGAVSHLHSVADTPELRAAYTEGLTRVTEFYTRLGADERLYAKYKAIDVNRLNPEQKHAHSLALRNFVLSGAELTGVAKERFAAIQEEMAEVSQKFSENVLDATDQWSLVVSAEALAGVPEDVLQATRAAAQADGVEGHKLSLKMPCYLPIMQFAHSAALRETLYRANVTRASDQSAAVQAGKAEQDNTPHIQNILKLRQEEAQLLGFANYAEVSLATKMAQSPTQVMGFLRDLAQRARPFAQRDVLELRQFAADHLGMTDPQAWDWAYIGEKLKEARYAFSEQEVKQYFTAPKVLAGLFKIVETLFEVSIRREAAAVWHPAVEFYRIERNGQLVGQFYLDPGARAGKRGGAWMDDVRARWLRPDTQHLQTPVAHLVCNFAEGVGDKPPLLTHDDVITLFHECGHGLHHLLTQINERDVSGISGVEWDAVELPSQFMENFCWEWSVLRHMTAHVDTGEPLPRALFDKMLAAKNFQSGLQTLRQIEFSLFDMRLHTEGAEAVDFMRVLREVRDEVAVLPSPAWARSPHTFSHIFAGGYAAGYYSYKWAEVLSADAYAAFEESANPDGSPSIETGRRYRQAILEAGGSRPAMASFQAFRGREPQLDALLRHQGMAEVTA